MKANRFFSPIGVFVTILILSTFNLNGYIGLVDASAPRKRAFSLFTAAIPRLVVLKNYRKRLSINRTKSPDDKKLDSEIQRVDQEINKIEDEMEKNSDRFLPAGEILSPGEIRLSGEDSDKLIGIPDSDLSPGKSATVTPTPKPQDQITPVAQSDEVVPGSSDDRVTPGAQSDQTTSGEDQVKGQDIPAVPTELPGSISSGSDEDLASLQLPGPPYPPPPKTPDFSTLRQEFSAFWDMTIVNDPILRNILTFGIDQSVYDSHSASRRAFSKYIRDTSTGVASVNNQMRDLMECRIIRERDMLFLQSFAFHFSRLSGIEIQNGIYCLLFTNSVRPNVQSFISNLKNYLNINRYTYNEEHITNSAAISFDYVAAKTFSKKNLTVTGVKKLVKENKELADECGVDPVTFATSLFILSDIYSSHLQFNGLVSLLDICSVLKGYQDFESRLRELSFIFYKIYHSHSDSWLDVAIMIKMSLESAYKALSISFSDYLLDNESAIVKKLTPMHSKLSVDEIIKQTDDDDVIRTSDRYIAGEIPIPEIPGPPSRRAVGGYNSERIVPVSASEIFEPKHYDDYHPFKKSKLHPPYPENLPEKAPGRKFVSSFQVHMKPRNYETEFLYGSSRFISPQLSYFKRVSEREYNHDMKLKKIEEERKRLEKKREQRMTRGYRDLRSIKDSMDGEESVSELPDTSEEPSPLPEMEESAKQIPSKFETKLHKLVPKTSSIYTQPSQRFNAIPITYTTLKPKKGGVISKDIESASKLGSEFELEDEVSEGTIGLPSPKGSDVGYSPESEISEKIQGLSISPKTSESVLTTEAAAREMLLKCPDLSKFQRRRALNLFRVLKYLYKGTTAGWYSTAFCRAVYFAERDVCVNKGVKALDIKKMASECYTALRSSSFVKNNQELSILARQVCYSYYKKRAASVCIE